jgi:hypothetical protein
LQFGIQRDFTACKKTVRVNVQDAIVGFHVASNNLTRKRVTQRNKDEKIF